MDQPHPSLHQCKSCDEFVQAFTDGIGHVTPEGQKALQEMGWRPGTLSEEDLQTIQDMMGEKLSSGSEEFDLS